MRVARLIRGVVPLTSTGTVVTPGNRLARTRRWPREYSPARRQRQYLGQ